MVLLPRWLDMGGLLGLSSVCLKRGWSERRWLLLPSSTTSARGSPSWIWAKVISATSVERKTNGHESVPRGYLGT